MSYKTAIERGKYAARTKDKQKSTKTQTKNSDIDIQKETNRQTNRELVKGRREKTEVRIKRYLYEHNENKGLFAKDVVFLNLKIAELTVIYIL